MLSLYVVVAAAALLFIPEVQGEVGTSTGRRFWFVLLLRYCSVHCYLHQPSMLQHM